MYEYIHRVYSYYLWRPEESTRYCRTAVVSHHVDVGT